MIENCAIFLILESCQSGLMCLFAKEVSGLYSTASSNLADSATKVDQILHQNILDNI